MTATEDGGSELTVPELVQALHVTELGESGLLLRAELDVTATMKEVFACDQAKFAGRIVSIT